MRLKKTVIFLPLGWGGGRLCNSLLAIGLLTETVDFNSQSCTLFNGHLNIVSSGNFCSVEQVDLKRNSH